MDNHLVSISCITYNHAPYIRQCLEGFMMQQCNFPFEVLIHDDASTDGTQEIIKEFQEKYPDIIKPIFQTENQFSKGVRGMMARFNFPRSQGKYIALCEGDDYWTDPLKLQKQVDFLEENEEYSFVSGNTELINNGVRQSHLKSISEIKFEDILVSNILGTNTCTLLFRSSALTDRYYQFSSKVKFGDWILYLFLLKFGQGFYLSDVLGCYRVHNTGMWSSMSEIDRVYNLLEMHNHFEEVFPEYLTQIKKNKLKELVNFQNIILNNYNKTRKVFDFELFLTKIKYRIRKVIKA